ncbi:hypothetical protein BG011_002430 [Mortierella polycephala]|uniref:Uncharacterized protein n=1 Tax=Mortierella polycephala TaxID=41804 RepID=A0A9P6TU88_9FUNG|nr:hypothetical protein BG011_002430 [Mortierella polycephala]
MATKKRGQYSTSVQRVPGKKRGIARTDVTAPRNKKFTKSELKALEKRRQEQFQLLLDSARNHDTESALVLPAQNTHQIQMVKVCLTIQKKLELIDIYEYLVLRQADVPQRVSYGTFGSLIGCDIAKTTMYSMHKRKEEFRAIAKNLPEETYYVLKRKQMNLEKVIVK